MLIAAFISRAGMCAELLEDVLTHHEWANSDFIIDEVCGKLRDKFQFPQREIAELCRFMKETPETVEQADIDPSVCRDAEDLAVLGTAAAALADLLICVEKDLLSLSTYQGIDIAKPGEFWKRTKS